MIPGATLFGREGEEESLPSYPGSSGSKSGGLERKVVDNGWSGYSHKGSCPSYSYVYKELLQTPGFIM